MNSNLALAMNRIPTMEDALLGARLDAATAARFSNVILPFELRPHQIEGLQAILAWPRVGLFHQTRTGKTITMQMAATYFAAFGVTSIFLMPPALFLQFEEEFKRIQNTGVELAFLNGTEPARQKLLREITNETRKIDVLVMTKEIFKKHVKQLMLMGFQALFFDECHMGLQSSRIQTKGGKSGNKQLSTYGSVKTFIDSSSNRRLILSTGTPVTNGISGAYPLISLKSPDAYASEWDFDIEHVTRVPIIVDTRLGPKTVYVVDQSEYRNVPTFTRNLYHHAVKANKLEVLNLRAPNIQEVPVRLHASHQSLYRKLMNEQVLEIGDDLLDARQQNALRMLALQLITDPSIGLEPGRSMANAVLETVQALLDTIDAKSNKVVLFANFNKSVELLSKALSKLSPVTIYGPNGSARNAQNAQFFKVDQSARLLVANPMAGGVGLTLGHVSQNVILVEPISTPGAFDQAVSRVILAGQTEPVSVYILRILDTISPKAIDSMLGKARTTKEALLDKKSMLDELLGRG